MNEYRREEYGVINSVQYATMNSMGNIFRDLPPSSPVGKIQNRTG